MGNEVYVAIELIGIIAFSISGAAVAFKKQMDLFGIIMLGSCTALGGGVFARCDVGNNTADNVQKNPIYAVVAAASSLVVFLCRL